MICSPTGNPSSGASPAGSDIAAIPARFTGIVATSLRYMAKGSSSFAQPKAVVGAVGEISTSQVSNADAKSRAMSVRTFWAWP